MESIKNNLEMIVNKPINDPFSCKEKKNLNFHAFSSYIRSLLHQIDQQIPQKGEIVKEEIIYNIAQSEKESFFENLKTYLYVDGATFEMVNRVVEKYISINYEKILSDTFDEKSIFKRSLLKLYPLSSLLNQITKATKNLSSGISIKGISLEDYCSRATHFSVDDLDSSNTYAFSYTSTDSFKENIFEYFSRFDLDNIQRRNFMLTLSFFEHVPVIFGYSSDKKGKVLDYEKQDDLYYFLFQYQTVPFFSRLKDFSAKNHFFKEDEKKIMSSLSGELRSFSKQVVNEKKQFLKYKKHLEDGLDIARERFEDLLIVDQDLSFDVYSNIKDIDTLRLMIDQMQKSHLFEEKDLDHFLSTLDNNSLLCTSSSSHDSFLALPNQEVFSFLDHFRKRYFQASSAKDKLNKIARILKGYEQKVIHEFANLYTTASNPKSFFPTLMQIIESKEKESFISHCSRVSDLSVKLYQRCFDLGIANYYKKEDISQAAYLHDFGKVLVSRKILSKEGTLDEQEWDFIKKHTSYGHLILEKMNLSLAAQVAKYHHEYWDGSKGYHCDVSKDEIPFIARLVSYADVFDAVAASAIDRPYDRKSFGFYRDWTHAVNVIEENQGKQFDPSIYPAFDTLVKEGFFRDYYSYIYSQSL